MERQQSVVYEEADKLLWSGRLTQAEVLLKAHIKDDPWAGFAYFQAMIWRVILLDLPEHDTQAQARADRLATSVEELISAASGNDPETKQRQIELVVLVGMTHLWKGILHTYKQRYVKAPMSLRYTWKMFERATQLAKEAKAHDPEFKLNSYTKAMLSFGFGIFHFAAAFAPKEVKSVVEMLGLSSDASKAYQELLTTTEIGAFGVTESLLGLNVLAQYFVDKPETVPGNFDKLLAKYPYVNTKLVFTGPRESPFLHSARGSFLRHQGHIDSALASFRESHKYSVALDPELKQFAATTSYQIGYCLFLKYEWLEASKEIQHFLSETKTNTYKSHAVFLLGQCLWFSSHAIDSEITQKVFGLYEKITTSSSSSVYDAWASRRAQMFQSKKTFTKWEEVLLKTLNYVEAHEYQKALDFLLPAKEFLVVPPFRSANLWCEYLYLKGACLRGLGRIEEAIFTFKKVIRMEGSVNTSLPGIWACAYASLESFEIHMEDHTLSDGQSTKNFPLARRWVSKALWYSGYTWDSYVLVRANIGQEKIRIKEREEEAKKKEAIALEEGTQNDTVPETPTETPTETPNLLDQQIQQPPVQPVELFQDSFDKESSEHKPNR